MTTPRIKFTPGNHQYRLDGKHVQGVTTLIKGGLPAPALQYWSARSVAEWVADNEAELPALFKMGRGPMVNALKEVPWQARDTAAAKGTDVHALAERLVAGDEVDVPESLVAYVQGYADFLDRWDLAPVLTEFMGANAHHWFAGTGDLIADLKGSRWLLDIKTGKRPYADAAMQLDAYRHFEFWQDGDGVCAPLPEGIERLGILHVTEGGTELYPLDSTGAPFETFLHVAHVARKAKKGGEIEGYLGTPLNVEDFAEVSA